MRALALDMGGSHIGGGVVEDDRLLDHTSIDSEGASSLAGLLPVIAEALHGLMRRTNTSPERCVGLAIGFPGIVDVRDGHIYSTLKKYDDAPQLNLTAWAQDTFGLTMRMENDARMALLGEQFAGAGRGLEDIVMMTLGTGIGAAAMIRGHLLRGTHAHAGCLGGHFTANFDGRQCRCGNVGCAEAEASGWSMPLIAREWSGFGESSLAALGSFGFFELFSHADSGDAVARAVRDRCLHVWAANAVSLIHAYDPDVLLLGGGVGRSADKIIPFLQDYVDRHTWSTWGKTRIRAATLGNNAALLGALPILTEVLS